MKASPFFLHRFFATNVVQCVVYQVITVSVKVNAGFAFTLNRLIYCLLRGEVKGEGKNGKFAESASVYIRVGACPARRVERDFVRSGEVLRETREEVVKSGDVWRESRLVFFERSGGGEENNLSCSVVLGLFCVVRLLFDLVLLLFRDVLLFFDPDCPVSAHPFSILILRSGILGIFPSSFFVGRFFFFFSVLVSSHSSLYFLSRSPFFKEICPFSSRFVCLRG